MVTEAHSDQRRWLLVLALIAGVLSMHALVVAGHGQAPGSGQTITRAAGHATTPLHAQPHMATEVVTSELVSARLLTHDPSPAAHTPPSQPQTDHGLLHLCLAVLAAMAALMAVALVWMAAPASAPLRCRPGGPDSTPARPPPRSSVRLALLCVLRN